jgi:hypothetical protein
MRNVLPAFKFTDDDSIPIGYKHITCHLIFDVKMVGLVQKARFVAVGHLTDPPVESVYSSVVTRESVRIMFLIAALNDLDILGADVQNAYINAKTTEKVYFTAGPEFGPNQGRPCIIVRALYGLKILGPDGETTWLGSCLNLALSVVKLTQTFGCVKDGSLIGSFIGNMHCVM